MLVPEPARGEGGMRRQRQLLGAGHHGGIGDGLRVGEIVGATRDLDQAAAPEAPAVTARLVPIAVAARVRAIGDLLGLPVIALRDLARRQMARPGLAPGLPGRTEVLLPRPELT